MQNLQEMLSGLMQIMEPTANEVAEKLSYNLNNAEELTNPEINIMLGTKYVSYLIRSI